MQRWIAPRPLGLASGGGRGRSLEPKVGEVLLVAADVVETLPLVLGETGCGHGFETVTISDVGSRRGKARCKPCVGTRDFNDRVAAREKGEITPVTTCPGGRK